MLIDRPLQGRGAAGMNMINAYYTHAWAYRNPSLYTASMPWTRRSQAGVSTLTVSTLSDYRSHLTRFMTSWHSLTPCNSHRVWMEAKVYWTGGGLWAISCLGDLMLESERTNSSRLQEMGCGNIRSVPYCNKERTVNHRRGEGLAWSCHRNSSCLGDLRTAWSLEGEEEVRHAGNSKGGV